MKQSTPPGSEAVATTPIPAAAGRAQRRQAGLLSIGVFFSLMVLGLAQTLPQTLTSGLLAHGVPAGDAARLAALPGRGLFPALISGPFSNGLTVAFAIAACLIAAVASWLRGDTYVHTGHPAGQVVAGSQELTPPVAVTGLTIR